MANHTLLIKTLSAVHIGSGRELENDLDFIHFTNDECLGIVDEQKALSIIGEENIGQWVNAINNRSGLAGLLNTRKPNLEVGDIAQRKIATQGSVPQGRNKMKEQLHNGMGLPLLPGSSLKGAIRTALLTYMLDKDKKSKGGTFTLNDTNIKNNRNQPSDKRMMSHFFSPDAKHPRENANSDLLRFLRVGDTHFRETVCLRSRIINQYRNDWREKGRDVIFWEALKEGQLAKSSIQVPDDLVEAVKKQGYIKSPIIDLLTPEKLFPLVNEHTKSILEREIKFWKDQSQEYQIDTHIANNFIQKLKEILEVCNNSNANECVLRLGGGTGWAFMTGDWVQDPDLISDKMWDSIRQKVQRKFYPGDVPLPKTRKVDDAKEPFGFIQLTFK
ncbi:MAG: type III-A CRISPR-associated RAMP protein Csm5 [Bernardetiaceae bacterium]|nr:type III-A CRISPR-associated RAMP protein Csm5 [Bernardetiaceae bacterium]